MMGSLSHVDSLRSKLEETLVLYHHLDVTEWNVTKKSKDVTVWRKPSDEFSGFLYKAEGTVTENAQRIVEYIRPGPCRLHWDSLMTSMEVVETLQEDCCVVKYTTAGQLWNIISPREFIDFSYTTNYENGLLSCGVSVDHDEHKQGFIRGFNHPCGWICVPVENFSHSLLTGYIQTDLRGMLPQSAVDTAMASSLIHFYSDLRRALNV